MIAFAWAVWIYRLTLFLGIAVLVYHFFVKAVGILLFAVEMGWFVARPILMEVKEWRTRADVIRASRRSLWPFGVGLLALALLVVPWSGRVSAPALLKAAEHVTLYAPVPGMLAGIDVKPGDQVAVGTVLAHLDNPDIDLRLQQIDRRIAVLKYEVSSMGFEDSFRNRVQSITQELGSALTEKAALTRDRNRLTLTASTAGLVADISPMVQPGQWINSKEPLLSVRAGAVIEAYVAEDDLSRIQTGGAARFIPDGSGESMSATIVSIDHAAVRALADPQLAVPYGGAIPARFDAKSLVPDIALYRVRLSLTGAAIAPIRGTVHMDGERRSLLGRAFHSVAAVIIREMGM
jgi:putative peptide zinc metalloprotease protein